MTIIGRIKVRNFHLCQEIKYIVAGLDSVVTCIWDRGWIKIRMLWD